MNSKYIHKKGIVYLNQYHVIFCPKYRRKVLTGNIEKDLRSILYEVAEENDVEIKAIEIMPSLWIRSYFCCTVGHISEEAVMKYIEEQKHF